MILEVLQEGQISPGLLFEWFQVAADRANSLNMRELAKSLTHWRLRMVEMFHMAIGEEPTTVYRAVCTSMLPRVGGVDSAILQANRAVLRTCQQLAWSKRQRAAKYTVQPHGRYSGFTARQSPFGFQHVGPSAVAVQQVGPAFGYGNGSFSPGPVSMPQGSGLARGGKHNQSGAHGSQPGQIYNPTSPHGFSPSHQQFANGLGPLPPQNPVKRPPLCKNCHRSGRPANHLFITCPHTICDRCQGHGHIAA